MTDKKDSALGERSDDSEVVYELGGPEMPSSSSLARKVSRSTLAALAAEEAAPVALSGAAAKLEAAELPRLERENRARLQMQTPNRLFFYWSVKHNPFQILNKAVAGGIGGYQLVVRLVDLSHESAEIHPAESSGSRWFDVDANCEYRGEVGFYAPNRPYVRVLYSNTVTTPRRRPSPRTASDRDWTITSDSFATVLSVSGFKQDAFHVAIRADEEHGSETIEGASLAGLPGVDIRGVDADELRHALLHLSLGLPMESLRWRIDASVFRILQQHISTFNAERALAVLKERYGVEAEEVIEEQVPGAVHGSSVINFPRILKKRRPVISDYKPISSTRV
jgi:hypothetical protein